MNSCDGTFDYFMCGLSQHLEIVELNKISAMIHSEDARESKLEAMIFSFWSVLVMLQTPFARSKNKSRCFAVRMARKPIVHQRVTCSLHCLQHVLWCIDRIQ
jgi:hypothetical protein